MQGLGCDREQLFKAARLARAEYLRLSDELNNLVREPSIIDGMESPDGIQAISNLGKQRNAAFEKYLNALTALRQGSRSVGENSVVIEDSLTRRELQILTLVACGKSSKQIAAGLGIAFRTVVAHRYHMQRKLGAHKAADLTRAAVRMGLIQP